MDPAAIQALYRFNTFANEALRESLLAAGDETAQEQVDMWFGSVFRVLSHVCSGEAGWLARLRDRNPQTTASAPESYAAVSELVERWRDVDRQWEAYVGSLSAQALEEELLLPRRSTGNTYRFQLWQPVLHVANHSTEHRGHATVALTKLGVPHSNQDFLDQFRRLA